MRRTFLFYRIWECTRLAAQFPIREQIAIAGNYKTLRVDRTAAEREHAARCVVHHWHPQYARRGVKYHMAEIQVSGLTFCYEGSSDNIFEDVSFRIDTDWRLGFIGRNGKGKTTFLKLLLGQEEYRGSIRAGMEFDYVPFPVKEEWKMQTALEVAEHICPEHEFCKLCRELDLMEGDAEMLMRPYGTLSHGERTKLMLALLFSKEQSFLLLDEPTNHLDMPTRTLLARYLKKKKGFILISHDRWFLNQCIDHVLVLNRKTITVEKGNFDSWWENKQRQDAFELAQNQKLKKEILLLEESARRTAKWADKAEGTKIGFDPVKEHDRSKGARAYIGEKSKKMQQRRKNIERRQQDAVEEKRGLLKDLETPPALKLMPLAHHKEVYLRINGFSYSYDGKREVLHNLCLEVKRGERVVLWGKNGCGKSTLLHAVLAAAGMESLPAADKGRSQGGLEVASGLKISYVSQDASFLCGSLENYIYQIGVEESLMKAVLRQLDFGREQFEKPLECYSEGQKKKVLIAGSLLAKAHLYIWDEPLNYIDVFSRMQLEKLILDMRPTMLLVEHDRTFSEKIATQIAQVFF